MDDFLDPLLRGVQTIHSILFGVICVFYFLALALNALTEWNVLVGAVAVAAGIYSIITLRTPSEFRGQPA